MRWIEKQERLQESVENCIDEIAEEFDLEVPYYPVVYWMGQKTPRYEMRKDGLQEVLCKEGYTELKVEGLSSYDPFSKSIILTTYHPAHKGEESSHFLHMELSGTMPEEYKPYKKLIVEMMGFFGSRVVCPNRIGYHPRKIDLMSLPQNIVEELEETSPMSFAYLQGYWLGGRIWNAYVDGKVSKKEIKEFYNLHVPSEEKAKELFLDLRERFWPIPSSEGWVFKEKKTKKKPIEEFRVFW